VGAGVDEKPPGPRIRGAFCEVTPAKLHLARAHSAYRLPAPQRHDRGALPAWLHVAHGCGDKAPDTVGGAAQRIRVKVRVARSGAGLRVPEQLADDRQPEPRASADARVRVAEIMKAAAVCQR
jgi:hypothetical protein